MPLTPRFDELISELDLPAAAWHLGRTNSWTEKHATPKEIQRGRKKILDLVNNKNGSVQKILQKTDQKLEKMEPWEVLLRRRQEATLASWGKPVTDTEWTTEYTDTINKIKQRTLLEKIKKQAELILSGWFEVIQGGVKMEEGKRVSSAKHTLIINQTGKNQKAA